MNLCSVAGCPKPAVARGWCGMHWRRWRLYGDPLHVRRVYRDDLARFWSKVRKRGPRPEFAPDLGPCWLWSGALSAKGYGQFKVDGKEGPAHRYAYELLVGPIPGGHHVDHLCRVRSCVNPEHLEAVTPDENRRRGLHGVLKTHCVHGHAYTPENTYRDPRGRRRCRVCIGAQRRRWSR